MGPFVWMTSIGTKASSQLLNDAGTHGFLPCLHFLSRTVFIYRCILFFRCAHRFVFERTDASVDLSYILLSVGEPEHLSKATFRRYTVRQNSCSSPRSDPQKQTVELPLSARAADASPGPRGEAGASASNAWLLRDVS